MTDRPTLTRALAAAGMPKAQEMSSTPDDFFELLTRVRLKAGDLEYRLLNHVDVRGIRPDYEPQPHQLPRLIEELVKAEEALDAALESWLAARVDSGMW